MEFAALMVGSTEDAPRADVGGEVRPEIIKGAVVIRLEAGSTADRIASVVRGLANHAQFEALSAVPDGRKVKALDVRPPAAAE